MSQSQSHPHSAAIQARIERHTMDLLAEPSVQKARREGEKALFEAIEDADAASRERFSEIADEITLNALVGLADGYTGEDLPRLIMRASRTLEGGRVPGNRGLHDNPDTFYRLIPLDGESNFILEGQASANPATIFELSALTSEWHTLANLSKSDLGISPGSRFRIDFRPQGWTAFLDADVETSGTKTDHEVTLSPDAEMLLVRETLADWTTERPSLLTIENRVDRGGPRKKDDSARVEAASARVAKWFREAIRLTLAPLAQAPNEFPAPVISGEHGKLVTMAYSIGHFWVRPGHALVLTIDPGSADYVGVPITNLWGTTNRNLSTSASWNSKQTTPNRDGTFTCVLALEDPGVHNWLDPDGLERGFLFVRWAGLGNSEDSTGPNASPAISVQYVPTACLKEILPGETRWLGPDERQPMLDQRRAQHALRFEEFTSE
jgi:hypothetical protein